LELYGPGAATSPPEPKPLADGKLAFCTPDCASLTVAVMSKLPEPPGR